MWQTGTTVGQGVQTQIQEIPRLKYKLPISSFCVFSTESKPVIGISCLSIRKIYIQNYLTDLDAI